MALFTSKIWRIQEIGEHAARGESPAVLFRRVDAPATLPPPRPAFIVGPMRSTLAKQMYGQTMLRPTGCFLLRDAAAGPTGVAIKDGHAFWADSLNHHRPYVQNVVQRINAGQLPVREIEGPLVAFLGPSFEVYGHFLVDYLPKLWLLKACGFAVDALKFLVPMRPPHWVLEILKAAGIGQAQLVPHFFGDEVIRTDRLIIPTIMRTYERLSSSFAEATHFWVDRLRSRMLTRTGHGQRIFISRSAENTTRRFTNRAAIEAVATQKGFSIVRPETLGLAEQIAIFAGASQIAGEYGSGLHNIVFSKSRTFTCALRGTLRDPGTIQSSLATSLGQRVGYVLGDTKGADRDQEVTIDLTDFERAIDLMELMTPRP